MARPFQGQSFAAQIGPAAQVRCHADRFLVSIGEFALEPEFDADDGYAEAFVVDQSHGPLTHRGRE